MPLETDKKQCLNKLYKPDKSKKGNVDEEIIKLIDLINSMPNYYTTSSCAGRVMLLTFGKLGKKHQSKWLYCSHKKAKYTEIKDSLKIIPKEKVWFTQEPLIVHVCCKSIEDAKQLLKITTNAGFKYSGITTISKKIILEIKGVDKMNTPISNNSKLIVDDNFLKFLTKEGNEKMKTNKKRIDKFTKKLKRIIKKSKEEMIDVIDKDENVIEILPRKIVQKKNLLRKACGAAILNSKKQILVHKRSAIKDKFPNYWDCLVGGWVSSGETPLQTIIREVGEEVGAKNIKPKLIAKYPFKFKDITNEIQYIYKINYNGIIKLQKEEVSEYKWVSIDELEQLMKKKKFMPSCLYFYKHHAQKC